MRGTMWSASQSLGPAAAPAKDSPAGQADGAQKLRNLYTCLTTEELCWGDAGLFLSIPNPGLGGAAVAAAPTLVVSAPTAAAPRAMACLGWVSTEVGRPSSAETR